MPRKRIDLTGQKFGRLTVTNLNEEITKQKKREAYWNCKCECGNEKVVRGDHLKNGSIISCGCYNREKIKEKWQDEEFRQIKIESSSKWLKEKWKDEEYKKMKSDEMRDMVKEKWKDEDFRQMRTNKIKQQWENEEYKQMMSNNAKQQWENEEYKQMMSNKLKKQWQDEEFRWKTAYKGGITPIRKHLRFLNEEWFNHCKQQANYTCELTGKIGGNLHTHHLKAFSTIVLEAHELNNIQVKPQVKDYTKEELHKLEEYVAEWHKDNSNAVVLCEEIHMLFHDLYGRGGNTPEQYEEFKQRYLNGEFEENLK